jgi:glycosyltransferase involved in cell wall biosynthesis
MPVYNAEKFLDESIASILNQTYTDFEFVIINDGSTDRSEEIIRSYSDSRIKYISNNQNIGLIETLNKGLSLIHSKYIVRMDSDDIAKQDRIERQLDYMEMNDQVAVCGSSIIKFRHDHKAATRVTQVITDPKVLAFCSIFYTCLYHPTVIIRNEIIKINNIIYNDKYLHAEDKAFWLDMKGYGLLGNIEEPLLYYRLHDKQVSSQFWQKQISNSLSRTRLELDNYGINSEDINDTTLEYICYPHKCTDLNLIYSVEEGMRKLRAAFNKYSNHSDSLICSFFRSQMLIMSTQSSHLGIGLLNFIIKSRFLSINDFSFKYYIKCLLKRNTRTVKL